MRASGEFLFFSSMLQSNFPVLLMSVLPSLISRCSLQARVGRRRQVLIAKDKLRWGEALQLSQSLLSLSHSEHAIFSSLLWICSISSVCVCLHIDLALYLRPEELIVKHSCAFNTPRCGGAGACLSTQGVGCPPGHP